MSIKNLNLRHVIDDTRSVVRLLSKRVAEQVKLLQEGKVLHELQKLVQVPQLVVAAEQHCEELIFLNSVNVGESVVRCVDFLNSEVRFYVVQVS